MSSCFLIGHHDATSKIAPKLQNLIEMLIEEKCVSEFIVGHYGDFDRLVAHALRQAKLKHPHITLRLLIPYHPSERPIPVPEGFDNTYYPPGMEAIPKKLAILKANQYIVDHVDHLVAYVWHPASNARNLLEYAKRRASKSALKIWNLSENSNMK